MAADPLPLSKIPGLPAQVGDAIEGLTLEDAATLSQRVASAGPRRREVLSAHHLDEATFARIEAAWLARAASAALSGDRGPLDRWVAAESAARARIDADEPLADEATWLRSVAARAEGRSPAEVAASLGLSLPALTRADAHYAQAARGDFELSLRVEAARAPSR